MAETDKSKFRVDDWIEDGPGYVESMEERQMAETARLFTWRGASLDTMRDILNAARACATRAEAQEFLRAYRETTPHADGNLRYMLSNLGDYALIRRFSGAPGI